MKGFTKHTVAILALLLLLCLVPQAAANGQVTFHPPGALSGEVTAPSLDWVLLLFDEASTASFQLDIPAKQVIVDHARTLVVLDQEPAGYIEHRPGATDEGRETESVIQAEGRAGGHGVASLWIQADRLNLHGQGRATLTTKPVGQSLYSAVSEAWHPGSVFRDRMVAEGPVLLQFGKYEGTFSLQDFVIEAEGIQSAEWYNTQITCSSESCISGGGRKMDTIGPVSVIEDHYIEMQSQGRVDMRIVGASAFVLAGADVLDAEIQGSIRLPLAEGKIGCNECINPENRTLLASGNLTFSAMQTDKEDPQTMTVELGGQFESARFDEMAVDTLTWQTAAVSAGTVAAAAGLALVVKIFLGALFTRRKRDPLDHPRRKAIFAYVCAHPGATFREVAREVDLAAGTARHHLTVLKRGGLVVEHPYRASVRFFENHGKFANNWREQVLLREPSLSILEEWIKAHSGAPQKDILDAMAQDHGWSRSTTQHRLGRLVGEGLAHVVPSGRLLQYRAGPKPGVTVSTVPGVVAAAPRLPLAIPGRPRPGSEGTPVHA